MGCKAAIDADQYLESQDQTGTAAAESAAEADD